jgi:hypothetical protein
VPEFIRVDARVMRDGALSPSAKMVYMAISAHADTDTRTTSLKVSDIAKGSCCARRTVQESSKTLALCGVIEVKPHFEGNRPTANRYCVIGSRAKCYAGRADAPVK